MEGLLLDPSFQILVEAVSPIINTNLRIDGMFNRDGKAHFFANDVVVTPFAGVIQQILIPAYSDNLISLCCQIPAAIGPDQAIYVCVSLVHGNVGAQRKVSALCSGWVYNTHPIGFPIANRNENDDDYAPIMTTPAIPLPGADAIFVPVNGLNVELVGFSGTFTAAIGGAPRNVGLEMLDTAGNVIMRVINSTPVLAGTTVNLFYAGDTPLDFAIALDLYIGGIKGHIRDPMQLQTNTTLIQVGDQWGNVNFFTRPHVIL